MYMAGIVQISSEDTVQLRDMRVWDKYKGYGTDMRR